MIYERSWFTNVRDLRTFVIYECSWFTDVRDSWTTRRSWAARSVKPVIQLIIAAFVFCIVISPMEVVWDLMLKVANFFFWQQPQRRRCPVEQRGTLVHLFVCLLVCSFVRASPLRHFAIFLSISHVNTFFSIIVTPYVRCHWTIIELYLLCTCIRYCTRSKIGEIVSVID